MSRQKRFEDEVTRGDVLMVGRLHQNTETRNSQIWKYIEVILDEISFIVYKRDKSGEILRNKRDFPKIDWWAVLWNIPIIIAKVDQLRRLRKEA